MRLGECRTVLVDPCQGVLQPVCRGSLYLVVEEGAEPTRKGTPSTDRCPRLNIPVTSVRAVVVVLSPFLSAPEKSWVTLEKLRVFLLRTTLINRDTLLLEFSEESIGRSTIQQSEVRDLTYSLLIGGNLIGLDVE